MSEASQAFLWEGREGEPAREVLRVYGVMRVSRMGRFVDATKRSRGGCMRRRLFGPKLRVGRRT